MKFPTFDLTGQVALVTGATKNIGHALALGLANAGADIVVVGRTVSECESTAEEIRAMGRPRTGGSHGCNGSERYQRHGGQGYGGVWPH